VRGGSALVLALFLVVVVGLLAAALCERAVVGLRVTSAQRERLNRLSIAESALVRTRFRLSLTDDWSTLPNPLYSDVDLFGGKYTVQFEVQESTAVVVLVTATYKEKVVRLRARIEKPPPWWSTNWTLRCPVTITERSGSSLLDYQVRVLVPYRFGMRGDYGDIRFVGDDQTTLLPYWIEHSDATSAIVWVKVPSIPANGQTRIWLYYGNPSAASVSSFTATMEPVYTLYQIPYDWVDRPDNTPWLRGLFVYRNLTFNEPPFPFRFPFYGTFYDDCHITTTGYIRFPAGNYAVDGSATESDLAGRRMFAAYWGRYSGRHVYDGLQNPGVYVYRHPDHVHVEWEVAYVRPGLRRWRWRPVGGVIHQALLYRNGDIVFAMKMRVGTAPGLAGISKGDGSTYIVNSDVGPSKRFLYAQRKFVSPEPSATVGPSERLQLTRLVWLQYE